MPTYEYECPKCGHRFEKFQAMSDAPIKTCPKCKGRKVRRLIGTGVGILFKGSGFYSTDYRSEAYSKAAKAAKAETTAAAEGSKDKAEKKPEKPAKKQKSEKSEKSAKPASS